MKSASLKGFIFSIEAVLSLLVAVSLLSLLLLSSNARENPLRSSFEYALANDIWEVFQKDGSYAQIANWAEGGESAPAQEKLEQMGNLLNSCLELEYGEEVLHSARCSGSETNVFSASRILVLKNGFGSARLSVLR
ncbi:MAG: hypothetical protein ABIH99_06010 [Candidatus Micrarchaeota archaeon]